MPHPTSFTITGTVSRGKHLLTRIHHASGDWTLHTHLKMEGHWAIHRPGERWRRPAHQARVVLGTADEVAGHMDELAGRGVERVHVWFADFAPPSTIDAFSAVIG